MKRGPLEIGSLIDGRHRLERVLGVGGFATVYLGVDTESGREVAIKVLNQPLMHRARFEREIQAVSQLRDPHTVRLFMHGEAPNGTPYIIFEYVPGRDLEETLKASGPLPPRIVHHVLHQVLSSLREAHQSGVVHRDIKPANILVYEAAGDPWCVKLLDFGIAGFEAPQQAKLTRTGELLGTPRYMSPEQLLSAPLGPSSDLYSLGVVALEMLVGVEQMHGSRWSDQIDRLQTGHLFAVGTEHAHLDAILSRMTARDQNARFQSAEAVLRALDSPQTVPQSRDSGPLVEQDSGPQRPHQSEPSPVWPPPRRATPATPQPTPQPPEANTKLPFILVGIALLFLALGGSAIVVFAGDRAEPVPEKTGARNLGSMVVGGQQDEPPPEPVEPAKDEEPRWANLTPRTSGCGGERIPSGIRRRQVVIPDVLNDQTRSYMLRAPRPYDPDTRYPLWLVYESVVFDPSDLIAMMALEEFADEHGIVFLVLPKRGDTTTLRGATDVKFAALALQATREELCIDPDRIFGVAHGKGAHFLRLLVCSLELAAIATVGDWAQGSARCEDFSIPYIKLAGQDDGYSQPFDDMSMNCLGEGPMLSRDEVDAAWKGHNTCEGDGQPWGKFPHGECTTWSCETPFVSCQYPGGHFFPERAPSLIINPCPAPLPKFPILDATLAFFDEIAPAKQPEQ